MTMPQFVRIGSKSDLPQPGEAKEFTVGGKVICVANVNGRISAMDNICQHHGGPLGQGVVLDGKVICPWHGWRWDPITGGAMESATLRIQIFPLKVEAEDVLVEM